MGKNVTTLAKKKEDKWQISRYPTCPIDQIYFGFGVASSSLRGGSLMVVDEEAAAAWLVWGWLSLSIVTMHLPASDKDLKPLIHYATTHQACIYQKDLSSKVTEYALRRPLSMSKVRSRTSLPKCYTASKSIILHLTVINETEIPFHILVLFHGYGF